MFFELDNTNNNEITRRTYNYRTTNWTKFRQIINNRLDINNRIETPQDIDDEVRKLTETLQHARDKTTRRTDIIPYEDSIPADIARLITFKNRLKRTWQRTRRDIDKRRLDDLQKNITDRLKRHREEAWNAKISSLSLQDNSLWRMTKLLKRPYKRIPTLVLNDVPYYRDGDKAEVFARHLQQTNTTKPNTTEFHDTVTNETNKLQDRYVIPPNKLPKLLTSPQKIKNIIKSLPNNKAPGIDSIPNIVLKNIPKKALSQITYIINSIIKLQYFPKSWKIAIIIPLLKPNKVPHLPVSYRPISLLNTLSKVAEKIILENINKIIEKNRLLPARQFGFRSGHSTEHALCRVVQDILQGYNKKQCTVLLLLDIEKAYDTVWHNGLIYKLHKICKLPLYMASLIRYFIRERSIIVRVNEHFSQPKRLSADVPQGAILSPILYNLSSPDAPSHHMANMFLYAHDTVLYGQLFYAQTAAQKVRYYLTKSDSLLPEMENYY